MFRLLILCAGILCLVLGAGCSHRGKQAVSPIPTLQAPLRAFLLPLENKEGVIQEDAQNLGLYLQDILHSLPHVELVNTKEAQADFSRKLNYQNSVTLRRLGDTHLVEAVLGGKVNHYSYQKDRNHLNLKLDLTLYGLNTYTGEKFFEHTKNFEKRYRVRNARNRDFSGYNRTFLNEVFGEFMLDFHRRVYALAQAQKERHGGVFPTRLISAGQSPHSTQPELMYVMLWPVEEGGQMAKMDQPIQRKPSISAIQAKEKPHLQKTQSNLRLSKSSRPSLRKGDPVKKRTLSWRERARQMAKQYQSRMKDKKPDSNQASAQKSSEEPAPVKARTTNTSHSQARSSDRRTPSGFDLQMPGYQLVYPPDFSPAKKYQKFYYLLDDLQRNKASVEDLNTASKETVVLEVFSTADDRAVKRFMDDYFHGVKSNPKGKIPEVYERIYSGKYQVGFKLEDKAVIATADRSYRENILDGMDALYVNNGGISVARIISRSFQKGKKAADIIFDDVKRNREEKARKMLQNKEQEVSRLKSRRTQSPAVASKPKPSAPQEIVQPVSSAPKRSTTKTRRKELAKTSPVAKRSNTPSKSRSASRQPKKSFPSNAVFFFDMARGYFQSGDFETAQRYFKLAQKHGYDVPELHGYLQRIQEEMGRTPVRAVVAQPQGDISPSALEYEEFDYARWRERAKTSPVVKQPSIPSQPVPPQLSLPQKTTEKIKPPEKPLEDFYKEMQKMENEIQRYMKGKSKLSTVARYPQRISLTEFLIQVIFLIASTLGIISVISSQRLR